MPDSLHQRSVGRDPDWVAYKTCDIEEALEDGVEGEKGRVVRRWWARNGLNLGVGTSEWMRTKVLCS